MLLLLMAGLLAAGAEAGVCALNSTPHPLLHLMRRVHAAQATLGTLQDPAAVALLKHMVHPTANYVGEQVTQVVESGRISRQGIRGDSLGRVRLDFVEPGELSGDVMIIAPSQFFNYHKRTNTLDYAMWPTGRQNVEKRIQALIQRGLVAVSRVGEEQIAGRNAVIIEIAPSGMPNGAERIHLKYWIDEATGIQLKNERYNARGLVSQSYLSSVVIGPAAGVKGSDFVANFPGARLNPLLPCQAAYHSVREVEGQLVFKPLEPTLLPAGFHLAGVWLFQPNRQRNDRNSVLIHYTNGLSTFSLFERARKPASGQTPQRLFRPGHRSIQRWPIATPSGTVEVTYIGMLSPSELQTLHDSLR